MTKEISIRDYSNIYLKDLTDLKFNQLSNGNIDNKRLYNFLPLYMALNKKVGNLTDEKLFIKMAYYLKVINDMEIADRNYEKFLNSFAAWKKEQKHRKDATKKLDKKLYILYKKYNLTTYKLQKQFGINLKIAGQIKNERKISSSNIFKTKLIYRITKEIE